MVEEASEEIETSGDAFILAEAIGYIGEGLHAIARAIERLAAANAGEDIDTQEIEYYMDGKRKE